MPQIKLTVTDPIGLHARPASLVVAASSKFEDTKITIESNGKKGNLKSIMNVMALGVKQGAEITIIAEGKNEDEALAAIKVVLKENKIAE